MGDTRPPYAVEEWDAADVEAILSASNGSRPLLLEWHSSERAPLFVEVTISHRHSTGAPSCTAQRVSSRMPLVRVEAEGDHVTFHLRMSSLELRKARKERAIASAPRVPLEVVIAEVRRARYVVAERWGDEGLFWYLRERGGVGVALSHVVASHSPLEHGGVPLHRLVRAWSPPPVIRDIEDAIEYATVSPVGVYATGSCFVYRGPVRDVELTTLAMREERRTGDPRRVSLLTSQLSEVTGYLVVPTLMVYRLGGAWYIRDVAIGRPIKERDGRTRVYDEVYVRDIVGRLMRVNEREHVAAVVAVHHSAEEADAWSRRLAE